MAKHSRFRCMHCNRPPQWEVLWADGRGRAWFCNRHLNQWKREGDREISRERRVDGVVGVSWNKPARKPIKDVPKFVPKVPVLSNGAIKEDAAFEREHPRGKGGMFRKKQQEWSGVSKEKWEGQERSELVSKLRSGAAVSQEAIDRYPDVKSALGETAEEAADRLGFFVEDTNLANDEFDRVIFGEVPDVLELNELDVVGGDESHPVYGGVHVGDVEYWAERLAHDYGYDLKDAKAIVIYSDEGDVLADDPQYAIPDESGIKAESGILVTARKELKRGIDFDVRPLDTSTLDPDRFITDDWGDADDEFVKEAYDERKHKRAPKGSSKGGQFTKSEGTSIPDTKGPEATYGAMIKRKDVIKSNAGGSAGYYVNPRSPDALLQFFKESNQRWGERPDVEGNFNLTGYYSPQHRSLVFGSDNACSHYDVVESLTGEDDQLRLAGIRDVGKGVRFYLQVSPDYNIKRIDFDINYAGYVIPNEDEEDKAYKAISRAQDALVQMGFPGDTPAAVHMRNYTIKSRIGESWAGFTKKWRIFAEAYDEGKHSRVPKGSSKGGQFTRRKETWSEFQNRPRPDQQPDMSSWQFTALGRFRGFRQKREELSDKEWAEYARGVRESLRGQESFFEPEEWRRMTTPPVQKRDLILTSSRSSDEKNVEIIFEQADKSNVRDALVGYGLNIDMLETLLEFKGVESEVTLQVGSNYGYGDDVGFELGIRCHLFEPSGSGEGDKRLATIAFSIDEHELHFGYMDLMPQIQGKGRARKFIDRLVDIAYAAGASEITLNADITIGKYAWARLGFDFAEWPYNLMGRFEEWAADNEIEPPEEGWPEMFETAADLANYDPGIIIKGSQISNRDVWRGENLHVGKAFMLDYNGGLGDWDGVLYL